MQVIDLWLQVKVERNVRLYRGSRVLRVASRKLAVFVKSDGNWDEEYADTAQQGAAAINLKVLKQR